MSQNKVKKARKEIKRVVREEFGAGLESLGKLVRPRPFFIPKFVWVLFYLPLFPIKHLKIIYKYLK